MGTFLDRLIPGVESTIISAVAHVGSTSLQTVMVPEGHFVWARLKDVRPFVRATTTTTADFGPVSSLCRSARDTLFGWHCQGIRDHLKSTNQSVLQKHTCRLQHVACQKHTFFDQKSTTHKWPTFRKLTIFGSVL